MAILLLGRHLPDGATKECNMTNNDKPVELETVACAVCMKEVPLSEATVPEATDYVLHFCGLDCYAKWKQEADSSKVPANTAGS